MRGRLLCRQIVIGLWWKEQSITVSASTMSCREIGIIIWAPTVAAVKRLICRLDVSSQADTPGQRATLQNTRFTSIAKEIAGRKPGHPNSVIRVWRHFNVDDCKEWEKMKWRTEYFRSKKNMPFRCLRRPNLFHITLLISSLVHVNDRVVMQNMLTLFPSEIFYIFEDKLPTATAQMITSENHSDNDIMKTHVADLCHRNMVSSNSPMLCFKIFFWTF